MSHPQRLLEVTINSAHDLPPMAKMLRTFVVAWVNPDNKLSTRVDHHGHTNPTWNDKLVFRVDDEFLRSESSSVMMVIYNLAWLRDLPMGTTNLNISQILKTLTHKNQALRNITLHIKRPTGHLQGTLNVSVNIVGYPLPTSIPETETQLQTASKTPSREFNQPKQESLLDKFDHLVFECKIGVENKISQPKQETLSEVFAHIELEKKGVEKKMIQPKEGTLTEVFNHLELERKIGVEKKMRQPKGETLTEVFESLDLERKVGVEKKKISQNNIYRRSITNSMDSCNADKSPFADSTISSQKSETATATKTMSSNDSLFLEMKTLPSEGASDMKKGYYSHSPGSSTYNDIFENWTEAASSERNTWMSKSPRWGVDRQLNNMLLTTNIGEMPKPKPKPKPMPKQRKKSSNKKGLLSCFGNLNGFQFNIFCGNGKKKRKNKYEYKDTILTSTDQSLRRFQF